MKKHGIFHPAGGESGRLSRQMPGLELTAYVVDRKTAGI
jgi:hypothetical protein